jgi:succinate dehydrogenase / fumarate reductase cytochrome b subunit
MADASIRKKPRPVNLDLSTIRLPLPGFVSILHRISGAGLFLMLPVLLWMFQSSLTSPETFEAFRGLASHFVVKLLFLGLIWAYAHHFCAGIRFLLLDMHMGIELEAARFSSKLVLAISIPLALLVWGVFVW